MTFLGPLCINGKGCPKRSGSSPRGAGEPTKRLKIVGYIHQKESTATMRDRRRRLIIVRQVAL
jgi:hypothetical protein